MEYMKKKKFKIALAQIKIEQKNIEENCKKIFEKIEEAAKENVDIICFPELATIGYNAFIEKLQEKAKFFKIHLLVGYLESKTTKKSRDFYNSCIFIDDDGKILANARKVYLWKREKTKFKAGNKFVVKNTKFGKIGILLCYDLEFPEPAVGDSCCGKSKIVEPDGSTLIEASGTNEELLMATIDLEKVSEIRAKIPYLTDLKK